MAGLYDGIEEVAFKRVSGGFVFQSNNPWFFGPRRRYFVNEEQKAAIAACIRETLKRIKPFVFIAAIIIPLVLVGGTLWLAFRGGTLSVTATNAAGESTSYTQPIDSNGSTVTLAGAAGAKVVYHVSGPPGKDATITTTWVAPSGKAGVPSSAPFGPGGMKVSIVDANHQMINSALLVGRIGATHGAIMLYAALLGLATFGPYLGLMHVYSMRRLRPLLVNLPRSNERLTFGEGSRNFAGKASFKLLVVMGIGCVAACVGNGTSILAAVLEHRPIANQPVALVAMALSALATAHVAYLLIVRARLNRNAA